MLDWIARSKKLFSQVPPSFAIISSLTLAGLGVLWRDSQAGCKDGKTDGRMLFHRLHQSSLRVAFRPRIGAVLVLAALLVPTILHGEPDTTPAPSVTSAPSATPEPWK